MLIDLCRPEIFFIWILLSNCHRWTGVYPYYRCASSTEKVHFAIIYHSELRSMRLSVCRLHVTCHMSSHSCPFFEALPFREVFIQFSSVVWVRVFVLLTLTLESRIGKGRECPLGLKLIHSLTNNRKHDNITLHIYIIYFTYKSVF